MKSFFALLLASASVYAAAPNVGLLDEQEVFKKYAKAVDLQAEIRKSEESAQASVGERVKVVEPSAAHGLELAHGFRRRRQRADDPHRRKTWPMQARPQQQERVQALLLFVPSLTLCAERPTLKPS